jgi:DNA-binding CsgD family transcriptional regulator
MRDGGHRALCGRAAECRTLDSLLVDVHTGESRVLVLRGEPGVGKTALLEYVLERAAGCQVGRAAGVQSEMELAFAGLHQVCMPLLGRLDRLPGPQREALSTAFGLTSGIPADRFFVGLAVLSLFSEAAAERPLVCIVDDAQWLDQASAQTLAFVARRLLAESVAMVFATREASPELAGLPELEVECLSDDAARTLLGSVLRGPLDERVRSRIVAETRGNPLALLELPPAELTGGFGLPEAAALSGRIEKSFQRRLEALPADTRRVLLIAAAEPVGDPVLVWRAAGRLGTDHTASAAAQAAGLVEFGARVQFRHPLVRSAVYRAATPEDRRRVHAALAEATDPELDPDRGAWHRAQAAAGPDEEVAAELERSAGRAQARGGIAAAAAFLERAAELTRDPGRRAQRALAAAQAKHLAGASEDAMALLAMAQAGPLAEVELAQVDLLHGQIGFAMSRGREVVPSLLRAATRLLPLDAQLARETYRDAFAAAWYAGRLADGPWELDIARAVRAAPPRPEPRRAPDLLLEAVATLGTENFTVAAPMVKRALRAFRDEAMPTEERLGWMWLACRAAHEVWDAECWEGLGSQFVELTRGAGAFTMLPHALAMRQGMHLFAGELDAARALLEEEAATTEAMGVARPPYLTVALPAWQGRETETRGQIEATTSEAVQLGEGQWLTLVDWASAVLLNGLGRYRDAMLAAERAIASPLERGIASWALPELVEAAVRCGEPEQADDALRRLSDMTRASATDWGLGVEAVSRALLSDGAAADRLYREAIERLGRARVAAVLARAHLVYGEWLRRERRRLDAREHLRTAHEMLTSMGMEAFAERARRELAATGETARKRTLETSSQLTAQEAQIARLARDGLSNPEIGAQLFISPRTVEYHLHKVFAKLDISSRAQLHDALPSEPHAAQLA